MRFVKTVMPGIVCFVLGAAVTRYYDTHRVAPPQTAKLAEAEVLKIDLENEPLWAYGFEMPAKPGDKAQPQNPPSRNLRANQDPEEQTRPRRLPAGDPRAAACPACRARRVSFSAHRRRPGRRPSL